MNVLPKIPPPFRVEAAEPRSVRRWWRSWWRSRPYSTRKLYVLWQAAQSEVEWRRMASEAAVARIAELAEAYQHEWERGEAEHAEVVRLDAEKQALAAQVGDTGDRVADRDEEIERLRKIETAAAALAGCTKCRAALSIVSYYGNSHLNNLDAVLPPREPSPPEQTGAVMRARGLLSQPPEARFWTPDDWAMLRALVEQQCST